MADLTVRDVTLAAPCRAKADTCRIIVPVTALLPQPEHGQVTALYETADGSSLGITLADLTREEAQAYQGQLEQAGFTLQFSEKEEASAGVILQREDVTVSLAYGDGTMGIWITLRSPDSPLDTESYWMYYNTVT